MSCRFGKFTANPPIGAAIAGNEIFCQKSQWSCQFLVPTQWPQFEPYALQPFKVILNDIPESTPPIPGILPRMQLHRIAGRRGIWIENLASPLIDFRDAAVSAGRSIMSGWRCCVAGCRAATGINARLANALAPNKAVAFKAALLFMASTSHLHLGFPCGKLVH